MTQPVGSQDLLASSVSEPGNLLTASGELDFNQIYTDLRLPNGEVVRLPTSLLQPSNGRTEGAFSQEPSSLQGSGDIVVPLVEETLNVGRRTVETGKVRLHKTVQEYVTTLDEPLAVRTYDVERTILNQPVDAVPPMRQEGETTIYPLVEERLILTKQMILKEEIRVTRRETYRTDNQEVVLRREHMTIERETVT